MVEKPLNEESESKKIRYPAVAGQFYPAGKETLLEIIKQSFNHALGAKKNISETTKKNKAKSDNRIIAGIAPHAGYVYSGPCQSQVYSKIIAKERSKIMYIIIGLSHQGFNSCICDQDFMTPLGIVKNNSNLHELIQANTNLPIDNKAHQYEHSIEVQLPFLQYCNDIFNNEFSFVPIIIGKESLDSLDTIAQGITTAIKKFEEKYNEKVKIITSSDFTHYGTDYGYVPKMKDSSSHELITMLDMAAIHCILEKNSNELYELYQKTHTTICGIYPILCMLKILTRLYPNGKGTLESYYTSQQIFPSKSDSSVSYAAITFKI